MKKTNKLSWLLAAAVSAALASSAMAQYRVGSDGRAHDANNRIGSGGINEGGTAPINPYQLNNQIVTGQVTGGRQFRGFVPYSDPNVFHGVTAGSISDDFIKQSSGAPYGGINQNNAQQVVPFYGTDRATALPKGFVQQSPGGGFVPAPAQVTREPNDLRLGETLNVPTTLLPQPGQLVLPGPVDPSTQTSSIITASPLYGVRQWDMGNEADQNFLYGYQPTTANQPVAPGVTPKETIQQMRQELMDESGEEQTGTGTAAGQTAGNRRGTNRPTGQMPTPFESPQNQSLNRSSSLSSNSALNTGSALNSNLVTGEGNRQILLTAPERQSTQYAELQKRLSRYRTANEMGDAAAAREFARQMREQQQQQQQQAAGQQPGTVQPGQVSGAQPGGPTATPGMTGPGMATPGAPTPGIATPGTTQQPANQGLRPGVPPPPEQTAAAQPGKPEIPGSASPNQATGQKPQPLQVHSLAAGVKAKGLSDLLQEAETQMKAGKYNSALEQYETAEQVAPNNPLILLGRANAELGQSYYTRAAQHLRQAFMKDKALLMGQYDLRTWLGDDRIKFLTSDLREIATREQKNDQPVFLLAYLAYNTGNERMGAGYLDMAQKRAGGKDPLYDLLRQYWALPADQGSSGEILNK